ncbi:hypothetical protein Runsl_3070 [Runella slithyformis DSM 19594]|uniref:Uncharacterized protein n=1 Tax=Runella slithyformis (strain ATCC 29530 / DSM 19594 / LMG 11500 / NCIMB 11436 / LSU 4) TaxID=761193 RepID=A0A7U4E6S2_RUNSL|nr:hypothetical protein Runsl_3070 [Runella slithyformis DSM 19594]
MLRKLSRADTTELLNLIKIYHKAFLFSAFSGFLLGLFLHSGPLIKLFFNILG